jgi:hypothetical protein
LLSNLLAELECLSLQVNKGDVWCWRVSKTGSYFVCSAYSCIKSDPKDSTLNSLWHSKVPMKVATFAWRLMLDRVTCKLSLARRGVRLGDDGRSLCGNNPESSSHLFIDCDKVSLLWPIVLSWVGVSSPLHIDIKSHYLQFRELLNLSKKKRWKWFVIWYAVIWAVWLARNNVIFNNEPWITHHVI